MTLIELKSFISSKILPSDFMIFIKKDNDFLANQYVKALGQLAPGGLYKVSSIYETTQSSLALLTAQDAINVLSVDTFDERAENYGLFENTVVVCNQVDKSIAKAVDDYIVKFPKLEEWQILDYAKTLCPGLDNDEITWLIKAAKGDINRILNELEKVSIFDKSQQKEIFNKVIFDPQSDLYELDLFKIANALVDGDTLTLFDFLSHNDYESLEPVVLANRAFSSLKNILLVSQNPALTAEDCGMSAGQFKFLKFNYRNVNVLAAKEKIKFLSNFDLDLKSSKLEMSKRSLMDYLISHLTYKITM